MGCLVCARSRCSTLKGGSSLGMPMLGLHVELDQLDNEGTSEGRWVLFSYLSELDTYVCVVGG